MWRETDLTQVQKWVGLAAGAGVDCEGSERSRETPEMAAE